jgi:DMSO/TMAO reductase YedYZ molybdopterin-dependent catalytic subunit
MTPREDRLELDGEVPAAPAAVAVETRSAVAPVDETARVGRVGAAVAGLVAAAVALGVGELVAGLDARFASPVEAVAGAVIERAPLPVERFAIDTFGSNDKRVLVAGVLVLSAVFAVVVGLVGRRRPRVGVAALVGFAAVGMLASVDGPGSGLAGVPSMAAGVAGVAALVVLLPRIPRLPRIPSPLPAIDRPVVPTRGGLGSRRSFFVVSAAVLAGAGLAAVGGRRLRGRFSAAESRASVRLPAPARPLGPVPVAAEVGVDGVAPFVTPNRDFYRVDTALVTPQVRAEDWTLRVRGLVDDPFELTYDELLARGLVEADITMTCVSNPVGGDLVGTARWLGVPVRDLLDQAGVQRGADQLVGRSTDGYTCGFPLATAYETDCMVAVGMNGEPLPIRHGFPARLVTPGVYGYVGSTKWLSELEVTTFDAFDQYWVRRGYAERAPMKTMARIDAPRSAQRVRAGRVPVAGVAWAQTRGIDAVEVRIDDGDFQPAELATAVGDDTWRQWRFDWDAAPGRHTLTVRATDGTGAVQTEDRADVVPDGASGWMSVVVLVDEDS